MNLPKALVRSIDLKRLHSRAYALSLRHLPNYSWHHLRGEENTEHGKSLRKEQTHDREHQHQASLQVWHTEKKHWRTNFLQHQEEQGLKILKYY